MTSSQTKILLEKFKTNPYLKKEEQDHLARTLNTSAIRIADWYRIRRFSQREKGLLVKGKYSLKIVNLYLLYLQWITPSVYTKKHTY